MHINRLYGYLYLFFLFFNIILLVFLYTFVPQFAPLVISMKAATALCYILLIYSFAYKLRCCSLIDVYTAFIGFNLVVLIIHVTGCTLGAIYVGGSKYYSYYTANLHVFTVICHLFFIYSTCCLNKLLADISKAKRVVLKLGIFFIIGNIVSLLAMFYHFHVPYHTLLNNISLLKTIVYGLLLFSVAVFIWHSLQLLNYYKVNRPHTTKSEFWLFLFGYLLLLITNNLHLHNSLLMMIVVSLLLYATTDIIFRHIFGLEMPHILNRLHLHEQSNVLLKEYISSISASKAVIKEEYYALGNLYEQIRESYPDALMVITDNLITYMNEQAIQLLGAQSADELLETDFFQYISPHSKSTFEALLTYVCTPGESSDYIPLQLHTLEGNTVDTEAFFIRSRTGPSHNFTLSIHDLSPQRREDDLMQKVQLEQFKVELFSTLSHELKTPINIIYSASQLQNTLIQSQDMEKICAYNGMISQNCLRLLKLLNNLLDINRIQTNYFAPVFQHLNIVSFTESILDSIQAYAKRKHIETLFDTEFEEIFIEGDPDHLERILLNLFSNAIKYTSDYGHLWVTLSVVDDHIRISVKDDGIGIPEDKQTSIFQRFMRVDNGLVRQAEGAGIGLSLVKSLIELNNGIIQVDSTPDVGSDFIVFFPTVLIEAPDLMDYPYLGAKNTVEIEFADVFI